MYDYGFTKMEFTNGVRVYNEKNSDRKAITDNDKNILFICKELRTLDDFIDEVIDGNNECAECLGYFTTRKNNTYLLWYDWEIDEYYITLYKSVFEEV